VVGTCGNAMPAMDTLFLLKIGKNTVVFYVNGLYFTRSDAGIASFALVAIPLDDSIIHNF